MKKYLAGAFLCLVVTLLAVSPSLRPAVIETPAVVIVKPTYDVEQYLQDVSVLVAAEDNSGSGVLIRTSDGQIYVLTAGHVVWDAQQEEIVEYADGTKISVGYSFEDLDVFTFFNDWTNDGELKKVSTKAQVIRCSDPVEGCDCAILRLYDKEFGNGASMRFYLDPVLPPVGTPVLHCGSMHGFPGANSITSGIISQHGRRGVDNEDKQIETQITAIAYPGSSGGVVALQSDGRYVGMLVSGRGPGFVFMTPVQRLIRWAKAVGVDFVMDPSVPPPPDRELFGAHPLVDKLYP